jgi:acetyl esterase/lipase
MAADGSATGPYSSVIQRGVEYAVHDGLSLRGDLYTPAAPGAYPALVMLHGGAWRMGSPASLECWGEFLAQHGYVVFAAAYRLVQDGKPAYPQNVHDAKAAVQFVRGQAAAVKADPARIGVGGTSAGGHLAALVGVTGDAPRLAGNYPDDRYAGVSSAVKAAVCVYGVYDLVRAWEHGQRQGTDPSTVGECLGGSPRDLPAVYEEASPLCWVRPDNNRVPFMLVWGTADDVVDPETQSMAFAAALEGAGTRVVALPVEGAAHYWFGERPGTTPGLTTWPGPYNAYVAPHLLRFLAEYL